MNLTNTEKSYLYSIVSASTGLLLYKASRDGFSAKAFHDRCDGKENTVTIIRNNLDYIFGGFTTARWSSDSYYKADPKAFIFSLRRNGTSSSYKLTINIVDQAIYSNSHYGPMFGASVDIRIESNSNIGGGSSQISRYNHPTYPSGSNSTTFLTGGSLGSWVTTEIEIFQIFGLFLIIFNN